MSGGGHGGNDGTRPPDPTMEDILASIRRILNEDEGNGGTLPTSPPGGDRVAGTGGDEPGEPDHRRDTSAAAEPEPEPLTLTEDMLVETPPPEPTPPAAIPMPPPSPEPARPSAAAEGTPGPTTPPPAADLPASALPATGLLNPAIAAATAASVGQLLRSVAAERHTAVTRAGPTIEDIVREELRPLLKEWLDQHLPPLVERLVRAEVERVVGRALS